MFTGIIQETAEVESISAKNGGLRARIAKPVGWKIKPGESISVDGVCSTAASVGKNYFEADYMPETLRKTTISYFKKGRLVNLERPLSLKDGIGGHLVQGHVDAAGEVSGVKKIGNSAVLKINFPGQYSKFIAEKGSVCVNGVSLTVASVQRSNFCVSLVDYTLKHTNLRELKKGDKVNIEVDIVARYIGALLEKNAKKKLR